MPNTEFIFDYLEKVLKRQVLLINQNEETRRTDLRSEVKTPDTLSILVFTSSKLEKNMIFLK